MSNILGVLVFLNVFQIFTKCWIWWSLYSVVFMLFHSSEKYQKFSKKQAHSVVNNSVPKNLVLLLGGGGGGGVVADLIGRWCHSYVAFSFPFSHWTILHKNHIAPNLNLDAVEVDALLTEKRMHKNSIG